jgi:hypothetical protein
VLSGLITRFPPASIWQTPRQPGWCRDRCSIGPTHSSEMVADGGDGHPRDCRTDLPPGCRLGHTSRTGWSRLVAGRRAGLGSRNCGRAPLAGARPHVRVASCEFSARKRAARCGGSSWLPCHDRLARGALAYVGSRAGPVRTWCVVKATMQLPTAASSGGFPARPAIDLVLFSLPASEPFTPDLPAGSSLFMGGVAITAWPARGGGCP